MIMNAKQIELITERAAKNSCNIVAVLENVVLCHRFTDDTYITWMVSYPDQDSANFYWGYYDMTLLNARESLLIRANWVNH